MPFRDGEIYCLAIIKLSTFCKVNHILELFLCFDVQYKSKDVDQSSLRYMYVIFKIASKMAVRNRNYCRKKSYVCSSKEKE